MDTQALMQALDPCLDLTRNAPLKTILLDAFRRAIVLGSIPTGTLINEKQLSAAMHISRTPIRSALDKLVEERLARREVGRGTVVCGISLKDLDEIYAIRCSLEVLATVRAAQNMTEADFDALRDLLERSANHSTKGDVDSAIADAAGFNDFIYRAAQMPRLYDILTSLNEYTSFFRQVSLVPDERRDQAFQEHWNIYIAMRFGDEARIRACVEEHLGNMVEFASIRMRQHGYV